MNRDSSEQINATIPHGLIDANGNCLSCCDPHALEIHLTCFWCDHKFHAVCRDSVEDKMVDKKNYDIICNRSFFNTYKTNTDSQVHQRRPHNVVMMCDPCKTQLENKKSSAQENKVEQLDVRVDSLSNNVGTLSSDVVAIKDMLEQIISNKNECSNTHIQQNFGVSENKLPNCNVWDDPEKVKNMKTKATMIIDQTSDRSNPKKDLEKLVLQNGIHVNKIYQNRTGDTVVELPTQNHRSNLAEKLNQSDVKFRNPDDLLPTISVSNLENELSRDNLSSIIKQAHPEIKSFIEKGGTFSVLNVRKQNKNDKYQANIRVSNNIRQFIENIGNRLYIGLQSCKVHDHFFVKHCNYCQKFGHFVGDCNAEKPTCGICASQEHQSKDCKSTGSETCSNCKSSKNSEINQNCSHRTSDINCASYKQAQSKLRNSILYYSSKN